MLCLAVVAIQAIIFC